jgi:predicted HTH transcriptional regulator
MIPDTLAGWTLPIIEALARAGVIENDRFDLKADLQAADHQRKTVAAFANSEGGFLVFGVTNDRRVVGVRNPELVRDFGGKLRDNLSPSVEFRFAERPHTLPSGNLVYVAHVSKSTRGPHAVYVNNAWALLRRTAAGNNDPMTYEEIRAAFTDARRRLRELAWLKAEVERLRVLAEKMHPVRQGLNR